MKHLTLGIGILAVLLVLCLGASWTMDRTSDQVAALLESAWEQAERDNLQAAAEQVEAAHRTWEQHRGISASLVSGACSIRGGAASRIGCGAAGAAVCSGTEIPSRLKSACNSVRTLTSIP